MPVTVIVEPDHGGHRFQAVANVARVAARTDDILLLTSHGASAREEFATFLPDVELEVEERFDAIYPPTADIAATVADLCRTRDVSTVVIMDADQSLKKWWRVAPRAFRGLTRRPRVIFFLTRYPAKLTLRDRLGWMHRVSKGGLSLLTMATGTLHRVGGFAGREDLSRGLLVKRVRDPAICGAHSRDRAALRDVLGLPADRHVVAILGVISDRKNVPLVTAAVLAGPATADLLLAGAMDDDVAAWLAAQPESTRTRVIVRDGFLSDRTMDELVAASDVIMIAQNNNGPSGVMGKALAAEVPVVSAGSLVRARELAATTGGVSCELTVEGVAAALHDVLRPNAPQVRADAVPPATGTTFGETVLGVGTRSRRRAVGADRR